jgi:hypothetical protein
MSRKFGASVYGRGFLPGTFVLFVAEIKCRSLFARYHIGLYPSAVGRWREAGKWTAAV